MPHLKSPFACAIEVPRSLIMLDIGYALQRDDCTKQPPDKITLLWNPQARPRRPITLRLHITKDDLLPCKSDMADAYSSLPTTVQLIASGLCLAYFLASHPGLWPWSRARFEHSL
jgi:hypothetical protein